MLVLIEAHVVEDEELGLGAEVSGVGQSGRHQIHLGLLGDVARIAVVALLGHRIDDVADHHHRRDFGERIEHVLAGIGDEQHVALVNGCPAANGRAVHAEAFLEGRLAQLIDRIRNVVPKSGKIGEAQVEDLDIILLHEFQDFLRIRLGVSHSELSFAPRQREGDGYVVRENLRNVGPCFRRAWCGARTIPR